MIKPCRREAPIMRIPKTGAALLFLLLLPGCAGMGAAPSKKTDKEEISIAALFQTENGNTLRGSAACFSTEANRDCCQVDYDGTASISGLPRSGEVLLTLFDQQQEIRGTMTLSFDRGAVIDATTGENGVGYITVRDDISEVALIFVLTESRTLRCALWLERAAPLNADCPQKGV